MQIFAMVSLILAQVATPSPTATPGPLREIGHVRTSVLCDSLTSVVLPQAEKIQQNDKDFRGIGDALQRFGAGRDQGFDPQLNAVIAMDPGAEQTDVEGNDPNVYTPERTMAASNIDRLSGEVLTTAAWADRDLRRAAPAHGAPEDPTLAALLRRLHDVFALQRLLAFRLSDVAGAYFSNAGIASFAGKNLSDRVMFQQGLTHSLDQDISQDLSIGGSSASSDDVDNLAAFQDASVGDLATGIRAEKFVLAREVNLIALRCASP